jgi:aldehyde dehydrogenase (NAD+)
MFYENRQFYIDGAWVHPVEPREFEVINPATEAAAGKISMGGPRDVDLAVAAARRAFGSYSRSTPAERLALLERVLAAYNAHYEQIALAIATEMGAPISLARGSQTRLGLGHIGAMIEVIKTFKFEELRGTTRLVQEPVGVCALITPWNWPMNQVAAKVIPALAAGCTMVLKPSEYSPFSAVLWAKVMHEAGVPAGVFNLLNGTGTRVGAPLSSHPDVDMVSFTGSTRAGTEVARNAAASVKRVHQELGGKSPNVLLDDADFEKAVKKSVLHVFQNSGQSCNAPTRMLVPAAKIADVEAIARRVADTVVVGDPMSETTTLGPVVSKLQFDRVEGFIEKGIEEGANLITGGTGRPAGLVRGYFVKPTIFSNVHNDMTIAREEIFGPVLCIIPCQTEDDAIAIANDTPYGLAAYVWSNDNDRAQRVGSRIRAGQVVLNGASGDMLTPFGGFKMSGNGREFGEFGLRDFLEIKAVIGADTA